MQCITWTYRVVLLQVLGRLLLSRATDLADHNDPLGDGDRGPQMAAFVLVVLKTKLIWLTKNFFLNFTKQQS
jgi:hypothetical protein